MNRALLLGGDIAAFAAALELAEVGVQVWIADTALRTPTVEARDSAGNLTGFLRELAAPLTADAPSNPGAEPESVGRPATRLLSRSGAWRPLPESSVWGIPTFPLSRDCIDLVGTGPAFTAYLDRLKPVLTIGKESNFGKLVEARLGRAVRETIVEPLIVERFGERANETEVALVEPGLNGALTRAGSLSGGALQQLEEHTAHETVIEPVVGWRGFGELLVERLALYGAQRFAAGVRSLDSAGSEAAVGWLVTDDEGVRHHFDAIVGDHADVWSAVAASHVAGAAEPGAAERAALSEQLLILAPTRTREYAEIGIEGARQGTEVADGADLLFLCEAQGGGAWAARASGIGGSGARLRLSGPVASVHRGEAIPGRADLGGAPPIAEALERLGAARSREAPLVRSAAAAFATAEQRTEQLAANDEWAEAHPSLLVVGASLHGGDIDAAVGDARERSVRLRRKLTGISE